MRLGVGRVGDGYAVHIAIAGYHQDVLKRWICSVDDLNHNYAACINLLGYRSKIAGRGDLSFWVGSQVEITENDSHIPSTVANLICLPRNAAIGWLATARGWIVRRKGLLIHDLALLWRVIQADERRHRGDGCGPAPLGAALKLHVERKWIRRHGASSYGLVNVIARPKPVV